MDDFLRIIIPDPPVVYGLIYKVTNTVNGKCYVGKTIKTEVQRWQEHLYDAKTGADTPLHRAIRKYGEDSFKVEVLGKAPDEEALNALEKMFIQFHTTHVRCDVGYNVTLGGDGSPGRPHTDEWKAAMSLRVRGEGHPMWGKKFSDKSRQKMSQSHKGRVLSAEQKEKLSVKGKQAYETNPNHPFRTPRNQSGENNNFFGRFRDAEWRKAQSERMSGDKHPMFGRKHSEEAKEKMRQAKAKRRLIEKDE